MRLAQKVWKMSVAIGLIGVLLLLSLAGTDVLIDRFSADELEKMGLDQE